MTALTRDRADAAPAGLAQAYAAARTRLGLVAVLFALAAAGWVWTAREMRGMDAGPWTSLGGFGWFLGVWVVMMAAMMLPSVAPTVALYSRMTSNASSLSPYVFAAGYLLTWTAVGVGTYVVGTAVSGALGDSVRWDHAGRGIAGVLLIGAAAYQLTPVKDVCLGKCRSPLGFLIGTWRDGAGGAAQMGARHGAWCLGCCWALMVALFALGVMSLVWMAVVASLITVEKLLPWRRVAVWSTTLLLIALALGVLIAPDAIPGFVVPGGDMAGMRG
jgi:predicted metal-binding membrane protein